MPSRPTVISLLALFLALAGTATAAKLVDGGTIRKGTVGSRQIADRSLGTNELKKSAIASLRRAARVGPISGEQIADGTVGLSDLAPNSVGSSQVVDRSLTAGDVANDTLTATEIGVGAVGDSELASDSVGNAEIKGQSISRNQLRTGVIRAGSVRATLGGPVANGSCAASTVTGATYSIPAAAFAGTVVEVETPATFPDGVVVTARPTTDGNDLRIQACNFTGAPVTLADSAFPFVAFGT